MVRLISWDVVFFFFLVFDFRSKFFNYLKKNYYCHERLLVSKKSYLSDKPKCKIMVKFDIGSAYCND